MVLDVTVTETQKRYRHSQKTLQALTENVTGTHRKRYRHSQKTLQALTEKRYRHSQKKF